MTYAKRLAIVIDWLGAALFWNKPVGVTISGLCALRVASGQAKRRGRALAWLLEKIDPGHLEGARAGDIQRARLVIELLS